MSSKFSGLFVLVMLGLVAAARLAVGPRDGLVGSSLRPALAGPALDEVPADSGPPRAEFHTEACPERAPVPLGSDFFVDISAASGIRDQNLMPTYTPVPTVAAPTPGPSPTPVPFIPTNCYPRVQFVDLDGDGYDEVVAHVMFLNPMNSQGKFPYQHLVYHNNGNGTFTNISDSSHLRDVQGGVFIFGDVDNDGDQDVFSGVDFEWEGHANSLWLNDGHGRFTVKAPSGLEGVAGKTRAANGVFADFDNDGDLDLFVGNGQTSYYESTNNFYLGHGDGTFEDATDRLGLQVEHPAAGSVACDYDEDGDQDIFVANYGISGNRGLDVLFENNGHATFLDTAHEHGFDSMPTGNYFQAETEFGRATEPITDTPHPFMGGNGFGIQCEDVNDDGHLDIFVGNISHPSTTDFNRMWSDPSTLLINQGKDGGYRFKNEYLERGIPYNEGDIDVGMVDFDNDSRMDLSVTREIKYEVRPEFTSEEQKGWFGLMHQKPDGTFASVGLASGINDRKKSDQPFLQRMKGTGSHAWSDIDHDGDYDLLVGACGVSGAPFRPNFLFENTVGQANDWLVVDLVGDGKRVNRDAIGAKVTLKLEARSLTRTVKGSRGHYNAMDMHALHFGLGGVPCDFSAVVTWPDGTTQTFPAEALGRNHYVRVRYGRPEVERIGGARVFLPLARRGAPE